MHEEIKLNFEGVRDEVMAEKTKDYYKSVVGEHGRIETRKHWISDDIEWLSKKDEWSGVIF